MIKQVVRGKMFGSSNQHSTCSSCGALSVADRDRFVSVMALANVSSGFSFLPLELVQLQSAIPSMVIWL
jgi:hypothetical protein